MMVRSCPRSPERDAARAAPAADSRGARVGERPLRPDAVAPCDGGHPRRWQSADLFGAAPEIEIEHGAAVYRLRRTALGKLILTK